MEVIMSSPVQEGSLMKNDDGNGAVSLTKSQRKRRNRALRKLNANLESVEKIDTNAGVGISATVDKMSMSSPAVESSDFDGEVKIQKKMGKAIGETSSVTNAVDNTASKRRKRKKMKNNSLDLGDVLSAQKRNEMVAEQDHAEVANAKIVESETTDLNVSGKEKKTKKPKSNKQPTLGEVLNPHLQSLENAKGETASGTISTDDSASKKQKRQKLNKNSVLGDTLSTCKSTSEGLSTTKVLEGKSSEMLSARTAAPDANLVLKGDLTEVANGKRKSAESETTNVNVSGKEKKKPESKNRRPTLGEILNPHYLQSLEDAKGETGSGPISTVASEKQKRQKLNTNLDLSDVVSTHEGTPEKLSTTEVLEGKSGETVLAKTPTVDANIVSNEDRTEVSSGKTGDDNETTNLAVNDKDRYKKRKRKAKSNNKRPTLGENLDPQYLQKLEASETGLGTISTDDTASEKQKKQKSNMSSDLRDILSTCESTQEGICTSEIREVKSGEAVLDKSIASDANLVSKGDNIEVVDGKMQENEMDNLNVNDKEKMKKKKKKKPKSKNKEPPIGENLDPQYLQNLEAAKHETGSEFTVLSTHESTQEGISTTEIREVKSGEVVFDKTNTSDAKLVAKGDHIEVVDGKMQEYEADNLNMNAKEKMKTKKKKKPKSKIKEPPIGENLDLQYLQDLEAAKHETGSKLTVLTQVKTLRKKLIILDVNGLLADVVMGRPDDIVADKYITRRAIFKRPYLDDFLRFCFERFTVGIWSSRTMKNLVPVINFLLGDRKRKLLFLWDKCKCIDSGIGTLEEKYKNIVVKDLRKIWDEEAKYWVKGPFNESNTLLVDDSPYKALLNPKHTGIFPASYSYKDRDDNFLAPKGELQTYLEGLAAADDVKTYVEQHPFGQGVIDEQSPHWEFYSSIVERLNDKSIMDALHKKNKWKIRRCRKEFYHPYR